ncbi:porin [Mucilaginibacter sp.]|uniref:porin n=1 Tax=Mucilaginibacter sp. TaxID=1882438 RepID=UPI003D13F9B6
MKLPYVIRTVLLLSILFTTITSQAQQNEDLLNILIKKNVLSQQEADSIRADQAIKEQAKKDKANQHNITIGTRALQISGLVQTEYQGFQQSGFNNSFSLHRARLDVKGDINDNWNYEVYTEFAGTTKLLDAYTTYKIADYLKFTAGQFKVPFSLESLISDSQLDFIDRSQVVNALAGRSADVIGNQNGRDIGIQIGGSFAKLNEHYLFDYTFGVFNGAGYDVTADNNSRKDIVGRLTVHPIKNLDISGNFYNGVGFYGTPAKNQKRNRGGFDARYVIGGLAIQAEYDKGTDGAIKRDGWFGQATYFVIPKRLQLAAKYDTYDPNKIVKTDRTNYYTGGVNYYFNNWARITLDYIDRREEITQVKNNIIETQLQLTF